MAAPPGLEEIVRAELREPIADLVRQVVVELVREQLNGAAPVAPESINGATPSTKVCRKCGREKPAGELARNWAVCKPCRREQNQVWEAERVERRCDSLDELVS